MLRVGLTGGIACGKSHVLTRLSARGFHVLDLDLLAHEVMAPGGAAHAAVVEAFGPGVLLPGGGIDRKRLGTIVFADRVARERLGAIVHPRVREDESRRAAAWAADRNAVVVSDAALLVEAGVHLRFDRLVVVHCRPEQQLARLLLRDGIDEAGARARIAAQMPLSEKRRFAHFEIDTSASFEDTAQQVDRLAEALDRLAREARPRVRVGLEQAIGSLAHGPQRGPRGLTPLLVLEEIVAASGLELAQLARRLAPPSDEPWYLAGGAGETGPGPAALMAPVVLWSLVRGAPDPGFVFAAAASLARLTHREAKVVASACLFARALLETAVLGRVPADLPARAAQWAEEAARWGGAAPDATLAPVFEAAGSQRNDVTRARQECERRGGDAALAGALVGLAVGAAIDSAAPPVAEALRQLSSAFPGPPTPS